MAKGYVILTEAIKDPEGMKAYAQAGGATLVGVNVLAVDTAPAVLEGAWHGDQTVVLEFESVDAAAPGTSPRPTRRRPSCAKRPPTAMSSSSPGSDR
jgi:uncharacterized protein (DUF1330 family)